MKAHFWALRAPKISYGPLLWVLFVQTPPPHSLIHPHLGEVHIGSRRLSRKFFQWVLMDFGGQGAGAVMVVLVPSRNMLMVYRGWGNCIFWCFENLYNRLPQFLVAHLLFKFEFSGHAHARTRAHTHTLGHSLTDGIGFFLAEHRPLRTVLRPKG